MIKDNTLHIQAGAGIVYDSVPRNEWNETMNKARAIFRAVSKAEAGLEGVEKSYAIQAGREIRIMVEPDKLNDAECFKLARDVTKKIESELQYPGQIKVTVLRETRAVEYAR